MSNGADYQYTLTYIATHHQKLGGDLGNYFKNEMMPAILSQLKKNKKTDAIPYVNVFGTVPDNGFEQIMDHPRYSTGYASLFNTPGSMPETHMLKEYSQRVKVTYEYMLATINHIEKNHAKIKELRSANVKNYAAGRQYTLQWELDSTMVTSLPFLGYEGAYKKSEVSGKDRLYYDRNKPFNKTIPYYQNYKPAVTVTIPKAYVIPKGWWDIIELLELNNIQMKKLDRDTVFEAESYRIADYKTSGYAYEGHYPHSNTQVSSTTVKIAFKKGDYIINTNQPGVKYLLETLEPQGVDSFFNWNFFDAVLQQKEYFSSYVFEDTAAALLKENSELKKTFEQKKQADKVFADDGKAQLDWIYRNSDYYEKSHLQYPVYRIMK